VEHPNGDCEALLPLSAYDKVISALRQSKELDVREVPPRTLEAARAVLAGRCAVGGHGQEGGVEDVELRLAKLPPGLGEKLLKFQKEGVSCVVRGRGVVAVEV
jgi:hypothetical protein